jgi:hypothetical protein
MKSNYPESHGNDPLEKLSDIVFAIRLDLKTQRAQMPKTRDRVKALEKRLLTEYLPAVKVLLRDSQPNAGYAYALCGAIHSELNNHREAQAAYTQADQRIPGSRAILSCLSDSATGNGIPSRRSRRLGEIGDVIDHES